MNLYQIVIRHVPGKCPTLPVPFAYLFKKDKADDCPRHSVMVFGEKARIREVRRRIEEIKQVPGMIAVYLWHGESIQERDCWILIDGEWVKGN